MGRKYGYQPDDVPLTEDISKRIVRLPFYADLAEEGLDYCLDSMKQVLDAMYA